ncbi:hypothetical protein VTK26DRAFT_2502 [Humicola hyalothermophila]
MRWFTRFFLPLIGAPTACLAGSGTVWITPHESYSSSVGVLGCKVDTNRIAYWPPSVDCNSICVSLTYEGRTVNLLRIDQSEGAHDVSYDAWNYLYTGFSATEKPAVGGPVAVEYKDVDPSACADLIHTPDHKLPLSAANSMNFLASCLAQKDSWVGKNYILYNILDPICSWGFDETCSLDWPTANQAACPHQLGALTALTNAEVYNIQYGTGKRILASNGQVVDSGASTFGSDLGASQKNGGRAIAGSRIVAMTLGILAYSFWCVF